MTPERRFSNDAIDALTDVGGHGQQVQSRSDGEGLRGARAAALRVIWISVQILLAKVFNIMRNAIGRISLFDRRHAEGAAPKFVRN